MNKVLLVEDHDIVRIATNIVVTEVMGNVIIEEASTFASAMQMVSSASYQLIILDLSIPGTEHLVMIEKFRSLQPKVPVLVFSGQKEEVYGVHCIRSGAAGFVSKGAHSDELRQAIRTVLGGQRYLSQAVRSQLLGTMLKQGATDPGELLSAKELVVMDMLLEGKWTKEIAATLELKSTTVSTFKTRIFKKFGVTNLLDLAKHVEMYQAFKGNDL
ncbi:DNA-binding response regulator [Dyadobacter beijingensis]|uniref:DNA-binding response regulator n=1 Tax=Dyadobacter beijingensis TaxID=365489 RepID=A0ABQ2I205_9BACT|nr:response regulator transcription factor [Dyadobacter beijingensis]GGM96300.1 DNA-binding response regulator [Dyadobacter beijingensis]